MNSLLPRQRRFTINVINAGGPSPTNYISVTSYDIPSQRCRTYFLFDDEPVNIRNAYYSACNISGRRAMWKRAAMHGPWDDMRLVGESPEDIDGEPESSPEPANGVA